MQQWAGLEVGIQMRSDLKTKIRNEENPICLTVSEL